MIWLTTAAAWMLATLTGAGVDPWPQWGGPSRNFVIEARDLATTWPAEGPRRVWKRTLGDGYSGIVADDAVIYTIYRAGDQDARRRLEEVTGARTADDVLAEIFSKFCIGK